MNRRSSQLPLMPSARWKISGKRHVTATAWKASIDEPAVQIGISSDLQSLGIAGTTSCFTYWWNWHHVHAVLDTSAACRRTRAPATLSHE